MANFDGINYVFTNKTKSYPLRSTTSKDYDLPSCSVFIFIRNISSWISNILDLEQYFIHWTAMDYNEKNSLTQNMRSINFNFIDKILSFKKFENQKSLILPEVCFAGRSNVGKSSLINSLLNRKSIARTSKRPGQTKTILFYRIDNYFSLVDVPGYGYAEISKKKSI